MKEGTVKFLMWRIFVQGSDHAHRVPIMLGPKFNNFFFLSVLNFSCMGFMPFSKVTSGLLVSEMNGFLRTWNCLGKWLLQVYACH